MKWVDVKRIDELELDGISGINRTLKEKALV